MTYSFSRSGIFRFLFVLFCKNTIYMYVYFIKAIAYCLCDRTSVQGEGFPYGKKERKNVIEFVIK